MKNIWLLLFITFSSSLIAQPFRAEGYYIDFKNDTSHRVFRVSAKQQHPNTTELVWGIYHSTSEGKKGVCITKTGEKVVFSFRGTETTLISVENKIGLRSPPNRSGRRFFATLIEDGNLKLVYVSNVEVLPFPTSFIYSSSYYWLKDGEIIDIPSPRKIKKAVPQLFKQCQQIINYITVSEKKSIDYREITKLYNSTCNNTN